MKVAISTDQGYVSAHFGRCPAYTILDIQEGKIINQEEIPNPGHQPGFLPQYLSEKGVACIIAGGMGPRAQDLFAQKSIKTIIGVQGPIEEVIQKFLKQELENGEDLCSHQHGEGHTNGDHEAEPSSAPAGSKICITAQGKDFESEIDPKFGRAQYFLLLDPIAMTMEVVENPNKDAAQGAGIQAAQFLIGKNVGVLITGEVGPNAGKVLKSSGIQLITGTTGKVKEVIQSLARGVK